MIKQIRTPSGVKVGAIILAFAAWTTFFGEYVISRDLVPEYLVAVCTMIEVFFLAFTLKTVFEYFDSKFNKSVTNQKTKK